MSTSEPQAIQILDDLLNGGPAEVPSSLPVASSPPAQVAAPHPPAPGTKAPRQQIQSAPPAPAQAIAPVAATAQQQALPGTTPPAGNGGPPQTLIPSVVTRKAVLAGSEVKGETMAVQIDARGDFESNLAKLLDKDLELAQHDRAMAIALFQTHLDRAEVLDQMTLSMPVAQVIADNTGATLKSLELAMKAGERVHKAAELLVAAQRNTDYATLAAAKLKAAEKSSDWGDEPPP